MPVSPITSARSIAQERQNGLTEWEIAQLPGIHIEPWGELLTPCQVCHEQPAVWERHAAGCRGVRVQKTVGRYTRSHILIDGVGQMLNNAKYEKNFMKVLESEVTMEEQTKTSAYHLKPAEDSKLILAADNFRDRCIVKTLWWEIAARKLED